MICLKGNKVNIDREYLMRVKKIDTFQTREELYLIYLLANQRSVLEFPFEALYLTNSEDPSIIPQFKNKHIIYGINDLAVLQVGDVVLVNTQGEITISYQRISNDNVLFVTQECNCDCIMCPQPPDKETKDYMKLNFEIIKLMDKKTKYLALTGGEPTLNKNNLIKIIKECKKYLPSTSLILLTNGINFEDFDFTKELILISHPDLTIAISLQSDIDEINDMMMGKAVFYKILKGLYNLARFQQKIEIRTVVTKLNFQRLPNFAEFVSYNFPFVYHVAIMGLEPVGNALKNINKLWVDPYIYQDILRKTVQIFHRREMNVSIYNHQLCVLHDSLWRFSKNSISKWKNIYLDVCERCDYKNNCGGLFTSSNDIHSYFLHPLIREKSHSEFYYKMH